MLTIDDGSKRITVSLYFVFFKQETAYEIVDCDWSSDVCSSDLVRAGIDSPGTANAGTVCVCPATESEGTDKPGTVDRKSVV